MRYLISFYLWPRLFYDLVFSLLSRAYLCQLWKLFSEHCKYLSMSRLNIIFYFFFLISTFFFVTAPNDVFTPVTNLYFKHALSTQFVTAGCCYLRTANITKRCGKFEFFYIFSHMWNNNSTKVKAVMWCMWFVIYLLDYIPNVGVVHLQP